MLTHFHSDHIGDLGELNLQTWAGGRPTPLSVYGGPGVEAVVGGFNDAYRIDQGYRTKHHTAKIMDPETWPMVARTVELNGPATAAMDRTALVLEDGALRVTAIEVDHTPDGAGVCLSLRLQRSIGAGDRRSEDRTSR